MEEKIKRQWHPAFSAAMHIELEDYLDVLEIEEEHLLSKKPLQMDLLIVKKKKDIFINKKIGHLFREHNIVEYKSPDDYLSINDFYKVYGYACIYQSDTEKVLKIDPREITITFVCSRYPRKMIEHLRKVRKIHVECYTDGIYHLLGDAFPIQIVLNGKLSKEESFWLQSLQSAVQDRSEIYNLMQRYEAHKDSKWYQAVMDLIVRVNWEMMKEEKEMCDALNELFADELRESREAGIATGREEGIAAGRKEGIATGREEGIKQGISQGIIALVKTCQDLQASKETTKNNLMKQFNLEENVAREYVEKYWE